MKDHKIAGISSKYYVIVILLTLVGWGVLPLLGVYGVNNYEIIVVVILAIFTTTITALRRLADRFRKPPSR
jgi:hypothetical protein